MKTKTILMKTCQGILFMGLAIMLLNGCKKTGTTAVSNTITGCKPVTESTSLSGNEATYEYSYGTDGNIILIKKYTGGAYHILSDSTVVSSAGTVSYAANPYSSGQVVVASVYNGDIYKGAPTQCNVSITIDNVEQRNYWSYNFSYDAAGKLIKVEEFTPQVANDYEWFVGIIYDGNNNATSLKYEYSTGPRTVTLLNSSGYDTHPNPFAGIKNWFFFMHAGWNNYDPEPVFTALSKNNPLGFVDGDWTRTMTYNYDAQGMPLTRTNTNTINGNSATFIESFNYSCK
jgi:YD repeat-containing protein